MKKETDGELVGMVLDGKREAFSELIRRYQNGIFSLGYQKTFNRTDAEDVAQEAFLRAYRDLKKLRKPELWGRWLYGIALNISREMGRARKPTSPLESFMEPPAPPTKDERIEELLAVVGSLPDKYRLPLTLHYVENYSYREIAEKLGLEESTARSQVHRAKAMVRQGLQGN
jgi:RNA polymerase sigma-70 factor (ECF subfamily)